jgi:hypothetical protein
MKLPSAIYAVVSTDPGEGIVSMHSRELGNLPMVALDERTAHGMLGAAREITRLTGRRLYFVRFEAPEVLAVLDRDTVAGKEG